MLIITNRDGKILENKSFKESELVEYIEEYSVDDIDNYLKGNMIWDKPVFCVEQKQIKYIALPACFTGDIYYCIDDEKIAFSTDFFEICKYLGKITFDKTLLREFLTNSYLHGNKTWVNEIKRLGNHCVYCFEESQLIKKKIQYVDKKITYETFKQEMHKCIRRNAKGNRNGLLLSGGADSRFLAIMLKNNKIPFKAYVGRILPYCASNLDDVENAVCVCKDLGVECEVVDIDYRKIKVDATYHKLIEILPNTKHFSVMHMFIIQKMKEDGIDTIWCGQNADNLYNLGPTGRVELSFNGLMNLYKRFCISENFYRAYKEVEGYRPLASQVKFLIAKTGLSIYKRMKHEFELSIPDDIYQLICNYIHSYDYTIFGKTGEDEAESSAIKESLGDKKVKPENIKKYLYKKKVDNYLKGGESEIIGAVARVYGIERVILPFSAEEMINVFYNIPLNGKSVFQPKEYIYQYIRENRKYGKNITHFGLNTKELEKYGNVMGVHAIYLLALNKSEWGEVVSEKKSLQLPTGYTGIQYTQELLGNYWMHHLLEKLKKMDLQITIKEY